MKTHKKNNPFVSMFRLGRPCSNCPFLKCGAIELEEGRLKGIVANLLYDDWSTFQCHKTVYNDKTGGEWDDDGGYRPSHLEAMCAGAAIYLEKAGRPNVAMRLAQLAGGYKASQLREAHSLVIEPMDVEDHLAVLSKKSRSGGQ